MEKIYNFNRSDFSNSQKTIVFSSSSEEVQESMSTYYGVLNILRNAISLVNMNDIIRK